MVIQIKVSSLGKPSSTSINERNANGNAKTVSSILTSRKTIDRFKKNTSISVKGRHDPCVGIRAVPIGEAMMHCVLLDHYLINNAQCNS